MEITEKENDMRRVLFELSNAGIVDLLAVPKLKRDAATDHLVWERFDLDTLACIHVLQPEAFWEACKTDLLPPTPDGTGLLRHKGAWRWVQRLPGHEPLLPNDPMGVLTAPEFTLEWRPELTAARKQWVREACDRFVTCTSLCAPDAIPPYLFQATALDSGVEATTLLWYLCIERLEQQGHLTVAEREPHTRRPLVWETRAYSAVANGFPPFFLVSNDEGQTHLEKHHWLALPLVRLMATGVRRGVRFDQHGTCTVYDMLKTLKNCGSQASADFQTMGIRIEILPRMRFE